MKYQLVCFSKSFKTDYNKIGLLWCHSHIELRLIEAELKLGGLSLPSFRGQFDTFLMADNFNF